MTSTGTTDRDRDGLPRPTARAWLGPFLGGATCLLALAPQTAGAEDLGAPTKPQAIIGGGPVASCEWPNTVWVDVCTATLIDPRAVVLASHCIVLGGTPAYATFGEDADSPQRQVAIEGCITHPGWEPSMPGDGNHDIAICELAEPVEDVPIVPILMGCEAEALLPGASVTLVGYGVHDQVGTMGIKYEVETSVQQVGAQAIFVGDGQASSCNGDSGGPAFLQLDDGSWRLFGVTSGAASTSPGCPQTAVYTMIHAYVPWLESSSGLDLTPCHDADGTWNPDERCTSFPLSPGDGGGQWGSGCEDGERSGPSATCGPAAGETGEGGSSGGDESGSTSGVDEDPSSGDGTEATSGEDDGGSGGTSTGLDPTTLGAVEARGDDPGCACRARRDASSPMLAWFAVVLASVARRRRRREP